MRLAYKSATSSGRNRRRLVFEPLERRVVLSATAVDIIEPVEISGAESAEQPALVPPAPIKNMALTTDPGVQQNPSIAVNPMDADHVVVAYMDYSLVDTGYAGIGVAVSHNGGLIWQHSSIPVLDPFNEGAANAIAKFDDQGRVYVSYMAATFLGETPGLTNVDVFNPERGASDREYGFQSNNGVFVARSDDGGLTWNEPSIVASHLFDGENDVNFEIIPDIGIDTFPLLPNGEPNRNHGNLYVTWSRLYVPGRFPGHPEIDGGIDIMVAVSRDGGLTWETQLQELTDDDGEPYLASVIQDPTNTLGLPGLGLIDQPHVAIGPGGEVYVQGPSFLSVDGGASFTGPDHVRDNRIPFTSCETTIAPLPNNNFRKNFVAAVATDLMRPGRVYVVDNCDVFDSIGNVLGPDINFAYSADHGETWKEFTVDGETAVLNDDNEGWKAEGRPEDVLAGQVFARLATDAKGNIGVIWYDTRRDPADHLLDVFGTISTDGGETFSPNFRITDVSFDADVGRFTNARNEDEFYIGDFIGFAMGGDTAYSAWTDTRNGNQDIFFSRFSINPSPEAFNDRFEPNDTPASTPTTLGRVVQRILPQLNVTPGDEDWFSIEAAASGELVVSVEFEFNNAEIRNVDELPDPESMTLEIRDRTDAKLLATGQNVTGPAHVVGDDGSVTDVVAVIGKDIKLPSSSGDEFQVRVVGTGSESVRYRLKLQSLTADLGTRAYVQREGTVIAGDGALYHLVPAAAGSLEVALTYGANVQGELKLEVLDGESLAVVKAGRPGSSISATSSEPNDSITEASQTGLAQPGSVTIDSVVGDGDFGATSGDVDFYTFEAAANHRITVDVNVVALGSDLDSLVALYDSGGNLLEVVDGASSGSNEVLEFVTEAPDTYAVAVMGWESFPPSDPFNSGTGAGSGGTGDYRLTITSEQLGPSAVRELTLPVRKGESFLILVSGKDGSAGDFTLDVTNLDQFATRVQETLFLNIGEGPSQASLDDLNGDESIDIVVTDVLSDTVSVLLGTGNGPFQASRQHAIGAFGGQLEGEIATLLPSFGRDVTLADFNGDGISDAAVTNRASADVSILLGRGDGTFEPQRRFDGPPSPVALESVELNGDGLLDLAVVSSESLRGTFLVSTLLGNGDGTFQPPATIEVPVGGEDFKIGAIQVGQFNDDSIADVVVSGNGEFEIAVLLGNDNGMGRGDGTLSLSAVVPAGRYGVGLAVADINGDGHDDILNAGFDHANQVELLLGNGDGTFMEAQDFPGGQNPVALQVVDVGSEMLQFDGSTVLGAPDGHPDVVLAASGVVVSSVCCGPPGIFVLPALIDEADQFVGLGAPLLLANATAPQDIDVGDVNNDGVLDVVAVNRDGVLVIFGKPVRGASNDTSETARDLGTIVHYVDQTQTIVPGREDAFYRFTVPTEVVSDDDQIVDVSLLFEHTEGPGLDAEVRDVEGNLIGSGERFRLRAKQGEELTLHVFGVQEDGAQGYGAFTPVMDVLPQLVSVESQALLPGLGENPGGPTTSIVLTFQGDRLDAETAENLDNYVITYFGADGLPGTADDQLVPIGGPNIQRPVIYDPSSNVDITTGLAYPTAIRQTVTLIFESPLPIGSYKIELLDSIRTRFFNETERELLSNNDELSDHPIVQVNGQITPGAQLEVVDLVLRPTGLGSFEVFEEGTRFLTQLQNDLQTLLDAVLSERGDDPIVTDLLLEYVRDRILPGLGDESERLTSLLILFFDPFPFSLTSRSSGGRLNYDRQLNTLDRSLSDAYVQVGRNIDLLVISQASGIYPLDITDVPQLPRAGALVFSGTQTELHNLTAAVRAGERRFEFNVFSGLQSLRGLPASPFLAAIQSQSSQTSAVHRWHSVQQVATLPNGVQIEQPAFGSSDVGFEVLLGSGPAAASLEDLDTDEEDDRQDADNKPGPMPAGEDRMPDDQNGNDAPDDDKLDATDPEHRVKPPSEDGSDTEEDGQTGAAPTVIKPTPPQPNEPVVRLEANPSRNDPTGQGQLVANGSMLVELAKMFWAWLIMFRRIFA